MVLGVDLDALNDCFNSAFFYLSYHLRDDKKISTDNYNDGLTKSFTVSVRSSKMAERKSLTNNCIVMKLFKRKFIDYVR